MAFALGWGRYGAAVFARRLLLGSALSRAFCLAGLVLCCSKGALAQPFGGMFDDEEGVITLAAEAEAAPLVPLRRFGGVEGAKALLGVDSELAIARLGSLSTASAREELVRLAEEPSQLSDRSLVLLSRALNRYAERPEGVRALYSILVRAAKDSVLPRQARLVQLAREHAALAIARGGSAEGLSLLTRMVKRGYDDGQLAARALLAHPPIGLEFLLRSPGAPNLTFIELLEQLGDQRAFSTLRDIVRKANPQLQARAALALTRLGALETVPLAKHWLEHTSRPEQRAAAVEILLQAQDAKAASAWQELYTRDRKLGLELALRYPLPALAEAVEGFFNKENDPALLTVLGHAGGPRALRVLESALASKAASAAAYGLARCPDAEATLVLERALLSAKPALQRWAARAAVVRSVLLGQRADGLAETLEELRRSAVRDDIFVGVWGSAVLDSAYATAQLRSPSLLVLSAAVASAGVQDRDFFVSAALALAGEEDATRRELLSVALLDPHARDQVPSHWLSAWANSASPLASLGVRALAERDDPRFPERSRAWLGAPASLLRAATALGYARHRDPAKSSELSEAFAFETDAEVRLAIVAALSHRAVPKESVLRWASDLDPDPRVRAAARLAASGQKLSLSPLGSEVAWLELPAAAAPLVVVVTQAGFAHPVPTAGQPVVPVLGVKSAALHVRLAEPAAGSNDAGRSGEHRDPPRKKVEPRGGNAQQRRTH